MLWLLFLNMIHMTMSNIRSECPDHCVCNAPDLECNKTLPSFIPENVSSVTAHEVPLEPYMNFTYTDWHNVTYLSLSLGNVSRRLFTDRLLQNYEFVGLINLKYLKILCNCYLLVNQSAFYGLTNLNILDLSNNVVGVLSDLPTGLKGEDIVPNISELYLSNITDWYNPKTSLPLSIDILHTALKNKPLKVLDLSGTNFVFYIHQKSSPPPSLLPQLHTLNISCTGSAVFSLPMIYMYYKDRPEAVFSNLQVLDASYPYFPKSLSECKRSSFYRQFCTIGQLITSNLPSSLAELHINTIFGSYVHELRGAFNFSHFCITAKFFTINKTICIRNFFKHLQKLDISNNAFTYIQPELIYSIKSLRHLDLSNNKLGLALVDYKYARPFFDALKSTNVILLSNNSITKFPSEILKYNNNTKLRIFNLSHNELISINFDINYLTDLKILDLSYNGLLSVDIGVYGHVPLELLDMSYNRIVAVDSAGCDLIKNLHFSSNTTNTSMSHNDGTRGLRLEGNPLSCSCDNLCLINFLLDKNETLTCNSDSKPQNITFLFVKHLEYSCKKGIVIATFTADAILTVLIIGLAVPVLRKERRRMKMKRLKENGIEQFSTSRKKYVVFLSFSGDDSEFVMTRVYPQLEAELKCILNTESDCVATGGTHFRPGHAIQDEIVRCVEESSVVIFFLSDTFINKSWCRSEVHKAFCDEKPIILMILGKLNLKSMPRVLCKHYDTFTRVHWSLEGGQYIMRPNMEHFCETIVGLIGRGVD